MKLARIDGNYVVTYKNGCQYKTPHLGNALMAAFGVYLKVAH